MFDTRDIHVPSLQRTSFARAAGWAKKGWHHWRRRLGLPLMAVASLLLAGGLLWQNNVLDPFKSVNTESPEKKQELKIPIKEQPPPPAPAAADASEPKISVREVPQALPRQPEPTPQAVPAEKNIAAVSPPKEEPAPTVPMIPPVESKKESPVVSAHAESAEKPEQKPPAEEAKVQQRVEAKKAPAAKEKPRADPTPARSPSGIACPFSLFLGSVPHLDQAEQGVSKYRKNGLPVYYTEVALSRGIWYRLYAGYFESEEQAERFRREKGLEGAEVKETPFANLIGTFTSQDKLDAKIESLKGLGFSHYVIRDADGRQRLLVGAFHNEERAKRQYEELKSKGIENQIVER